MKIEQLVIGLAVSVVTSLSVVDQTVAATIVDNAIVVDTQGHRR